MDTCITAVAASGERIYQAEGVFDVVSPNIFGSILDLDPDTACQARFTMTDPDGLPKLPAEQSSEP
ncbi:MAG: hypothetical protein QOJ99_5754 [Bryobacterales bacterium]|nr:hypothetical protein [Bryobacterales bacterium]